MVAVSFNMLQGARGGINHLFTLSEVVPDVPSLNLYSQNLLELAGFIHSPASKLLELMVMTNFS